jgi:signal transduction histidine kinase
MRRRIAPTQVLAFLLLAVVLVLVSVLLELANVARLATDRAATECEMTSRTVRRQLDFLLRESPGRGLRELALDPRLSLVLTDAIVQASSVLHVAVCDTNGIAVAHTLAAEIGTRMEPHRPIPRARNLLESFGVLWGLRRTGRRYEMETPLVVEDRPFATIRVVVPRTFLWGSVTDSLRHGLVVAVVVFFVAIGAGVALSRIAVGRVRQLEEGVTAIREGRFETAIPESGAEEFRRLARELNLLGEQYRKERRGGAADGGGGPGSEADPSRVLMRLGEMATGVAHELRDPLQSLSLELDAVSAAARGNPEVESHVSEALRKVGRLDRAIRAFLTIVRLRPTRIAPLDVGTLVREVRNEMEGDANVAGLDLVMEEDSSPLSIAGDAEVLRHALRNVVRNSIQAQPSRDGRIVLRCGRDGGTIHVSVADAGPGIPESDLRRVFDLFYTTKPDGTGVGLALVRQAVEMHGGEVAVRSSPNEGTVVTMQLPVSG